MHLSLKKYKNHKINLTKKHYLTQQFRHTSGSHSRCAAKHGHFRVLHWPIIQ